MTISIRSKEKGWVYKLLTGPMFTRIRESVELAEWVVYSPKIVVPLAGHLAPLRGARSYIMYADFANIFCHFLS